MARLGLNLVGHFQPLGAAALPPIWSHRICAGTALSPLPSPSPLVLCKSPIPPLLRAAAQAHPGSLPQSQLQPRQVQLSSPPIAIPTSARTSAPARAASSPPLLHPFMDLFAPQTSASARSFSCFSLLLPLSGAAGGRLSHRLSLLPRQPFRRPSADYQNFSLGCSKTLRIFLSLVACSRFFKAVFCPDFS